MLSITIPNWVKALVTGVVLLLIGAALLPFISAFFPSDSTPSTVSGSALTTGIFWAVLLGVVAWGLPWQWAKKIAAGAALLAIVFGFFFSGIWRSAEQDIANFEQCVETGVSCPTDASPSTTALASTVTIPPCGGPDDYVIVEVPRGNNVSWTWSVVAYAITDGVWVLVPPNTNAGNTVEAFAYCADKVQHTNQNMPLYWS